MDRLARRRWRRIGAAALATAVALSPVACGGDDEQETTAPAAEEAPARAPEPPATVDADAVERQLKKNLHGIEQSALPVPVYPPGGGPPEQSQIGGGKVRVRSVSCPEDIPAEKGGKFSCDIDARKTQATVNLTQLNDSGTKLRFKATLESEGSGVTTTTRLSGKIDTSGQGEQE